jgi:hypothetical protein
MKKKNKLDFFFCQFGKTQSLYRIKKELIESGSIRGTKKGKFFGISI